MESDMKDDNWCSCFNFLEMTGSKARRETHLLSRICIDWSQSGTDGPQVEMADKLGRWSCWVSYAGNAQILTWLCLVSWAGPAYCPELVIVSPSANPVGEYGSVYPFYVYDVNRPLAPILRQRRCSWLYDVYWPAWWWWMFNGIKITGIQFQNHQTMKTVQ